MKSKGKVFLVDDDDLIVSMLSRALKKEGYDVRTDGGTDEALSKIRSWAPDIVVLDINLPGRSGTDILQEIKSSLDSEVVMLTADDTAETAVKAMKLGAADYFTKPFNMDEVKIVLSNIVEKIRLKNEVDYLRKVNHEIFEKEIVGNSKGIQELKAKARKLIESRVPTILVTGESGTGKELLARYIHRQMHGESVYAPFVGINCAALPESLLESELFGYEKGSFTDAKTDKKGLFELADRGSILLDEIGEMKTALQSKFLRVIEERTVRRIGGKDELPVDVVAIATTNRDLEDAVDKGDFRLDLFYRLNAFSLLIPPLRERAEDIPLLARHFLGRLSAKYNKTAIAGFSPEAEKLMVSYRWPGNIRELRNMIERLVVLETAEIIMPEHLPKEIAGHPAGKASFSGEFSLPDQGLNLDDLEKQLIIQALTKAGGNKTVAAKLLGLSYDSLRYQIKKFGLE
ncbi:MAG TPA: sigma-54 dependent transcriptional regulator [Dissulfurispiraceae bacterium]|nr:sigma-54 dependent transcriptional regulator [Dissulfurispiraceae bacterium]